MQVGTYELQDTRLNRNGFGAQIKRLYSTFIIMILAAIIAVPAVGFASNVLELYDYGSKKNIRYTDKQIKVTLNGYDIDMKGTPGILVDGYSMVSYYDVFKTALGLDCVYDSQTGTVTIEYNSKKIVLTIGSKTALVDGKKVTMGTAPVKIKFKALDKTKVLVPSRFVSEQFGFSYTWTSSASTVAIIKPLELYYNKKEHPYTGAATQAYVDGTKVSLGKMPGIILSDTTMLRAKKVFGSIMGADYSYDSKTKTVVLSKGNLILTMTLGEEKADLNGTPILLEHAPLSVKNLENDTSYILVPAASTARALGYRYTWDNPGIRSVIETTENTGISGSVVLLDEDGRAAGSAWISPEAPEIPSEETPSTDPGDSDDDTMNEVDHADEKDDKVPAQVPTVTPTVTPTPVPEDNADGYPDIQETLITWDTDVASALTIQNIRNGISTEIASIDTESITSLINVSKDYALNSTYESYTFWFNAPVDSVQSALTDEDTLQIMVQKAVASELVYSLRGSLVSTIHTDYIIDENGGIAAQALIELGASNATYSISLSEDRMSLILIVTANYLERIQGGTTSEGEYLLFEGMQAFDPIIVEGDTELTILLPYTVNGVGYRYYMTSNMGFESIEYINISSPTENQSRIGIGKDADTVYNLRMDGNRMYLYLSSSETTPETPPENSTDTPPDTSMDATGAGSSFIVSNIQIPLPSNITMKMLSDEDLYLQSQFVIRIAGDYTNVLNTELVQNQADKVDDISISYKRGFTEILFTTSEIQGYRYQLRNHILELEVRDPDQIYDKIVVLDPGHGGTQPGAVHSGHQEKNLTLTMLYTMMHEYFENSDIKAYYTRIDDSTVTLTARAAFAKKVHADIFISLHMNAAEIKSAAGTSVYYSTSNNSRNVMGLRSQDLAKVLSDKLSSALGTRNRGIPTASFDVIHRNTVPAALIELAFMTNAGDMAILTNSEKQQLAAKTIYDTVVQIFEEYPTER